jgi:hypothetical protein
VTLENEADRPISYELQLWRDMAVEAQDSLGLGLARGNKASRYTGCNDYTGSCEPRHSFECFFFFFFCFLIL